MVLNAIYAETQIPKEVRARITELLRIGAIEPLEAERFVLAKRFYQLIGRPGEYTRAVGLDRAHRKALLLQHLRTCEQDGAPLRELAQVIPSAPDEDLRSLLEELCSERLVKRASANDDYWFAATDEVVKRRG